MSFLRKDYYPEQCKVRKASAACRLQLLSPVRSRSHRRRRRVQISPSSKWYYQMAKYSHGDMKMEHRRENWRIEFSLRRLSLSRFAEGAQPVLEFCRCLLYQATEHARHQN